MKNNITKVITCFFIVLLSICSLAVISFAHSGRTDGSGGHYNHSTGEYHYHHGHPAHQHIDGECPYKLRQERSKTFTNIVIFVVIGAVIFIFVKYAINSHKEKKKKEECERLAALKYNEEKRIAVEKYEGKSIKDFVDIPTGSMIGDDGLPRNIGCSSEDRYWGKEYTFYVAYNGTKYHKENCRYAKSCYPQNAYNIKKRSYISPCYYCMPKLPELEWVDECHKIQRIQKKFDINMPTNWSKD